MLSVNNNISNIIRDYYGITLSFRQYLKNKLLDHYKNISDTTILLLDIFNIDDNLCADIEAIFTSKEKLIDYIVNREIDIYINYCNRRKIIEDVKKIDTVYQLIPIDWINNTSPVYVHEEYYVELPLDIYKEPKKYLIQNIHNDLEFYKVSINPLYPLDKSIIDI